MHSLPHNFQSKFSISMLGEMYVQQLQANIPVDDTAEAELIAQRGADIAARRQGGRHRMPNQLVGAIQPIDPVRRGWDSRADDTR